MRQEMSNTNSTGADGAMEEGPIPALGPSRARCEAIPAPCDAERASSASNPLAEFNLRDLHHCSCLTASLGWPARDGTVRSPAVNRLALGSTCIARPSTGPMARGASSRSIPWPYSSSPARKLARQKAGPPLAVSSLVAAHAEVPQSATRYRFSAFSRVTCC